MTLKEHIELAKKTRDEFLRCGTMVEIAYCNGYLSALETVENDLKDAEEEVNNGIQKEVP